MIDDLSLLYISSLIPLVLILQIVIVAGVAGSSNAKAKLEPTTQLRYEKRVDLE